MGVTNTKITNLFYWKEQIEQIMDEKTMNCLLAESETIEVVDQIRAIIKGIPAGETSEAHMARAKRLGFNIDGWGDYEELSFVSDVTITYDDDKVEVSINSATNIQDLISDGSLIVPEGYFINVNGNIEYAKTSEDGLHTIKIQYFTDSQHFELHTKQYTYANDGTSEESGDSNTQLPDTPDEPVFPFVSRYQVLKDEPYYFHIRLYSNSPESILSFSPEFEKIESDTYIDFICKYDENKVVQIQYYSDKDGATNTLTYELDVEEGNTSGNEQGGNGTGDITPVNPDNQDGPTTDEPDVQQYNYVTGYEVISHDRYQFCLRLYTDSPRAIRVTNGSIVNGDNYIDVYWNYNDSDIIANISYYYTPRGEHQTLSWLLDVHSYGTGSSDEEPEEGENWDPFILDSSQLDGNDRLGKPSSGKVDFDIDEYATIEWVESNFAKKGEGGSSDSGSGDCGCDLSEYAKTAWVQNELNKKLSISGVGVGGITLVSLTRAEYNKLSTEQIMTDSILYNITDATIDYYTKDEIDILLGL